MADELSLPTLSQRRLGSTDQGGGTLQTSASVDFTKRITPNLGIGLGASTLRQRNPDGATRHGFDNWAANVKYQFYKSEEHETIASVGVDWDIGGSGARSIGAEAFSTFTPGVFVGKGFGDLPDAAKFLRPFAVTGVAGYAIPSRSSSTNVDPDGTATIEPHSHVLRLGAAIEYSVPYLQSFVKDVGIPDPFRKMIPLVELDLQKPVDRGASGWTGTVNPGVVWAGRTMQLGLEAVLPVNGRTGGGRGFLFQVHFFLDDLYPRTLGKPLFQ